MESFALNRDARSGGLEQTGGESPECGTPRKIQQSKTAFLARGDDPGGVCGTLYCYASAYGLCSARQRNQPEKPTNPLITIGSNFGGTPQQRFILRKTTLRNRRPTSVGGPLQLLLERTTYWGKCSMTISIDTDFLVAVKRFGSFFILRLIPICNLGKTLYNYNA